MNTKFLPESEQWSDVRVGGCRIDLTEVQARGDWRARQGGD